uniref:Uncharacterized protein n=1 Tax=Anguilla anguilla TaxID=7936 RepID=A0A0E9SHZ3_ANGAN
MKTQEQAISVLSSLLLTSEICQLQDTLL